MVKFTKSTVAGKVVFTWKLKADECGEFAFDTQSRMSMQLSGRFNGAKCIFEGTNDKDTEPSKLYVAFEGDFDFTKPSIKSIPDISLLVRPKIVGGDKSTEITVTLLMVP